MTERGKRIGDGEIHLHIHFPELTTVLSTALSPISATVDQIHREVHRMAGELNDLRAANARTATKIDELATTLTEVASDQKDLIERLASGIPDSEEVKAATAEAVANADRVEAAATALRGIADAYAPPAT